MRYTGKPCYTQQDWTKEYKDIVKDGGHCPYEGFNRTLIEGAKYKLEENPKPVELRRKELDMYEKQIVKDSTEWL